MMEYFEFSPDKDAITLLAEENADLRRKLISMHRRAQASEGAVLRFDEQAAANERLIRRIRSECESKIRFDKSLYDDAVEQIRSAGVDDTVNNDPNHRTGHLHELIRRLIEQRDERSNSY